MFLTTQPLRCNAEDGSRHRPAAAASASPAHQQLSGMDIRPPPATVAHDARHHAADVWLRAGGGTDPR